MDNSKRETGVGGGASFHVMLATLMLSPCAAAATAPECRIGPWMDCNALQLQSGWPMIAGTPLDARIGLSRPLLDDSRFHGLRMRFDARSDAQDLIRRWRYGVGLDLEVPGDGLLQTSFQTSRRRSDQGVRYALTPEGLAPSGSGRLWSLGMTVAPGDDGDGDRRLVIAPQFRLDLDRCLPIAGRAELSAEFAPWAQDFGDNRTRPDFADDRVPQMRVRWRF